MKIYVILETYDASVLYVHTFTDRIVAKDFFDRLELKNSAVAADVSNALCVNTVFLSEVGPYAVMLF